MDYERSFELSSAIGRVIARENPRVDYTPQDVEAERALYSEEEREEMRSLGLLGEGERAFEAFFVIREFLARTLPPDVEGEYLAAIFAQARLCDAEDFLKNPYFSLHIPEVTRGKIRLTTVKYDRGEIFQYDMPDLDARLVAPKLGFFDREVAFPALYEGTMPWVSVCPSEVFSMERDIGRAHGRVLVLGLGLGYCTYRFLSMENVTEVTVVEKSEDVLSVFREALLPSFPTRVPLRLVAADALDFMETVKPDEYDFVYADIWEGAVDGAPLYTAIRRHEPRLGGTEFVYWIEAQIRAYLSSR